LINRRGPFWRLRDPDNHCRFDEGFLRFLTDQDYSLITVVMDKKAHIERYGRAAYHPYHYGLAALLERYGGFLSRLNARGDVMAESRGRREDQQLKAAYRRLYESGTQLHDAQFFRRALTSKEIKLKPKLANIAGLQVADLLAYPCKQGILIAEGKMEDPGEVFGKEICRCVGPKHNRRYLEGRVKGYRQVFLK